MRVGGLGHLGVPTEHGVGIKTVFSVVGGELDGARVGVGAAGGDDDEITITSSLIVMAGASLR